MLSVLASGCATTSTRSKEEIYEEIRESDYEEVDYEINWDKIYEETKKEKEE
jgi:hypothetical protein